MTKKAVYGTLKVVTAWTEPKQIFAGKGPDDFCFKMSMNSKSTTVFLHLYTMDVMLYGKKLALLTARSLFLVKYVSIFIWFGHYFGNYYDLNEGIIYVFGCY